MENDVREYYDLLLEVTKASDEVLEMAYRQLRELLEQLCRTQMPDSSLQMTDLSARINFVASKVGLSVVEQNRLHTFRLTSNAILNRQAMPQRAQLLRDAKTLAFFVKRLYGTEIPPQLYHALPRADSTYIVAPPAREQKRRMRVSFQYADNDFLYVLPTDMVADEPLKVRYNVPQINEEFAETCQLLWRNAQVNLLDVRIDEDGVLTTAEMIECDVQIDFYSDPHRPGNYARRRAQAIETVARSSLASQFFAQYGIACQYATDARDLSFVGDVEQYVSRWMTTIRLSFVTAVSAELPWFDAVNLKRLENVDVHHKP